MSSVPPDASTIIERHHAKHQEATADVEFGVWIDGELRIEGAIDILEFYASAIRAQRGSEVPGGDDLHLYTTQEPYAVGGQLVPWNYPLWAAA